MIQNSFEVKVLPPFQITLKYAFATKILSKVFISQESHAMLLPHEAALDKTGKVPSPDYKTV